MKNTKTLCLMLLAYQISFSQINNPDIKRTNHWYFGQGAGLDFTSGTPIADTSSIMFTEEACFTMSDTCGNLLFYGQEDTLYNKNHQMMANGDLFGTQTIDQMICAPQPGNDSLFYVFYPKAGISDGTNTGAFRYAIVNINKNNGFGEVISKDNVLFGGKNATQSASNKCAGTYHCNGQDIWIIGKIAYYVDSLELYTDSLTTNLYAFLLSSTGLNITPVVSRVARLPNNTPLLWEDSVGMENHGASFRFSPDGTKAAAIYYGGNCGQPNYAWNAYLEFYKFDNCTGIFFNPIAIQLPTDGYSVAFSPDGNKVYASAAGVSSIGCGNGDTLMIMQYDISNFNPSAIASSETTIIKMPQYIFGGMQLAMDGKIYVSDADYVNEVGTEKKMGVIKNPNASGTACDFVMEQTDLGGREHFLGLPNFIDSYFGDLNYYNCYNSINEAITIKLKVYPNPFIDILTIENADERQYDFMLYDLMGRQVYHSTFNKTETFNLCHLQAGVYFSNIIYNNQLISNSNKIIKL